MDLGLKDKVAIITGSGSVYGFGHATALTLAKEGCDIVVNDINIEGAERTVAEIEAIGRKAIAIKADVGDSAQVNDMVQTAIDKFGKVDIMINNAGAGRAGGPIHLSKLEEWDVAISLLFKGVINGTKAVLPHMIERRYGKIINTSSGAGRTGSPNNSVYSACKAAVINFTKSIAAEVGDKGINVNCICPGLSTTNFIRDPEGKVRNLEHMEEIARVQIPMQRLGVGQDIANMMVILASDISGYVTGQTISVNGGTTMT